MSAAQGKWCSKCRCRIPAEEVQLGPGVPERCHDCGDYCDDPDCARCAAGSSNTDTTNITKE
ncbi:MAG TPA: hypothetical protein VGG39_37495 [Polyangiaceae bacterium]